MEKYLLLAGGELLDPGTARSQGPPQVRQGLLAKPEDRIWSLVSYNREE